MKVQINEANNVLVSWQYDNKTAPTVTKCIVKDMITKEQLGEAVVKLYHKDTLSKDAARRFSMTKVLKEMGLPKAARKSFWSAYLSEIKVK